MKKILGMSLLMITLMAAVGGGTWAWFQDTETSANNSLTAGTLDLNVNGGNSANATFTLANLAPGNVGSGSGVLSNVGSLDGELDVSISNLTNVGGSGGTEFEDGIGELGYYGKIALFIDVDQDGVWSNGDIGLKFDGTTYAYYTTGPNYERINWYDGNNWDAVVTLAGGASDDIVIFWTIPSDRGNYIQGDSVTFDLGFTLEQAGVD